MAMSVAREHGLSVDEQVTKQLVKATVASLSPFREDLLQTNCTIAGITTNATYALISMKEEKHPRDGLTDAIVHCLAEEQEPDGEWPNGDVRPPLGTGPILGYGSLFAGPSDLSSWRTGKRNSRHASTARELAALHDSHDNR